MAKTADTIQVVIGLALLRGRARGAVELLSKTTFGRYVVPVEGSKIQAVASVEGSIPVLISWVRAGATIDQSISVSIKTV